MVFYGFSSFWGALIRFFFKSNLHVIQIYFCHINTKQRVAYLLRVWWARGRRRALVSQIKLDSIMRALAFPRMRVYSVSSLHPWNERGTEKTSFYTKTYTHGLPRSRPHDRLGWSTNSQGVARG